MKAETLKNQQDRLVELFISDDKDTRRQACELIAVIGGPDPILWYAERLLERVWTELCRWSERRAVPDRVILHLEDWDTLIRWAQLVNHMGPVTHDRGHGRDLTNLVGVRAIVTRDTERGQPALVAFGIPSPQQIP